jgi:hypothetical protein
MAIPRTIARWNKAGLNRVTRRIAPWMPGFGVADFLTLQTAPAAGSA